MNLRDERVDLMMVKMNVQIHILFKVLLVFAIMKKRKKIGKTFKYRVFRYFDLIFDT